MAAKKRQTMGKLMRERERAEKRARKQEKKEQKKAAALAADQAEAPVQAHADGDDKNETPLTRGLDSV
jgi:imidazolonepropionase-like amidohydrolase